MKVLIIAFLTICAVIKCGYAGGHGGYGGGGGGGGGHGGYTPIIHHGAVVSKVFGPPPHPHYQPVPIPHHDTRSVILQPAHALVIKGEGFGYSGHGGYGHH
ncbi:uncharacterized protein LOC143191477 [Rhynchophorus ferrugineus]|uniref:uncharacterized protein LOC143191477 n=1 Tax=Rhynchophorus ferrugineus TaxID=354439 RepID=UPI003FCED1BE